ncbi:MAG: sulfatase [Opitutae bacterium]|jgi:arylsulfatase A-like enzyme|nr:sulfatase [Opitutae bacterium]MBT5716344.1 sulfatase [Opitutae bacterium]
MKFLVSCFLVFYCFAIHLLATPNILFIAIDDLNDWVGFLGGHPQVKTPNIDRLSKRGFSFNNAHCQAPICGPSRASLLSGYYPHRTGLYQQPGGKGMENDEKFFHGNMLPQYFGAHGYSTWGVGKIGHGYSDKKLFDSYGGKFDGSGPKPPDGQRFNYFLPDVPYTGTQTDWGVFPQSDRAMPDYKIADWAIQKLDQKQKEPFFGAVGFIRPHVPFYVPQQWFDLFPEEEIVLPEILPEDLLDVPQTSRQMHELPKYPKLDFLQKNNNQQFRKCVHAYLACIAFVDHQVGRVLDALDRSSHANNTIIVLFSDHGYHIGEKDRVSKHSLWEESTRVPLIVVPAKQESEDFKNGTKISSEPVGLIDLYPTLTDMCGLPLNRKNEGLSLVPLIKNETEDWRFAIMTTYARGNHALRSENFRYLRLEDGAEELYDHKSDPNEWKNLAGGRKYANLIKKFRKALPKKDAPYHPVVRSAPINSWFEKHFKKHRL